MGRIAQGAVVAVGVFSPGDHQKISVQENGEATLISYTSDKEFFQGKTETFSLTRFFFEVTQRIPPRGARYIRCYGLYASRGPACPCRMEEGASASF